MSDCFAYAGNTLEALLLLHSHVSADVPPGDASLYVDMLMFS